MEAWATVVIVLVSNAIIGAVSVLTVRKQMKHSQEQFKMEQEGKKEADRRERQREVRDEALVKLRDELARMAGMLRFIVDLAYEARSKGAQESEEMVKDLDKVCEDWNEYSKSGEFFRTLGMQYDYNLASEAHDILRNYISAYNGIRMGWGSGKGDKGDEALREARDAVLRNDEKVSEVQSQIIKLREVL